jgi:hypothetical protein
MEVYKVVKIDKDDPENIRLFSACIHKSPFELEYVPMVTTYPPSHTPKAKILAFSTKEDAKDFLGWMELLPAGYGPYELWRALTTGAVPAPLLSVTTSNLNRYWDIASKEGFVLEDMSLTMDVNGLIIGQAPEGSLFCDDLTLIERIT